MPWYAVSPRDAADPRWPLPQSPAITLEADDPTGAQERFLTAYPSRPYGTPTSPVADAGMAGFAHDVDALRVEPCAEPPARPAP